MSNTISRKTIGNLTVTGKLVNGIAPTTRGALVTVVDKGDSAHNLTTVTVPTTVAKSISAATSAAVGHKLFTFPAGDIFINKVYMSVNPPTGGPASGATTVDMGLGTTIASGAKSTLDAVSATCEDILTGQSVTPSAAAAVAVVSGGGGGLSASKYIAASAAHTVYLNAAAVWDVTGSFTMPGTVTIDWTKLS